MTRSAEVILREAGAWRTSSESLGQVSRFETKHYVGTAKILDLERSAPESEGRRQPSAVDGVIPCPRARARCRTARL
jgi:hypothetical protein